MIDVVTPTGQVVFGAFATPTPQLGQDQPVFTSNSAQTEALIGTAGHAAQGEVLTKGLGERGSHQFQAIGRLKPGVAVRSAQSDLALIAARLEKTFPDTNQSLAGLSESDLLPKHSVAPK